MPELQPTFCTPGCCSAMTPVYCLKTKLLLPASLEEIWDFFSNPANLGLLTPPQLNLKFTNALFGKSVYPGQIIAYRIRPFAGIPVFWLTEITQVKDRCYFIDEQRMGPYAFWHHQHHFETVEGGVRMTDIVHYQLPGAFLGTLLHDLWVRKQLLQIFRFRTEKIAQRWPGTERLTAHPETERLR
jgi:ligand-binding SRPBCC domain-containing protein